MGLSEFDVVYDTMGGDTHVRSRAILKSGGMLVCLNAAPVPDDAPVRDDISVETPLVTYLRADGERIAGLIADRAVEPSIGEVFSFSDAIDAYRLVGPRPKEKHAVPEQLDWDLWIGNAPERPFVPGIYHASKWRAWQDFGTGWSGDIGCHVFDATWKALGLTAPKSVSAKVQESWKKSAGRRGDTWPQSDHITWKFPGTSMTAKDEITVEWFDGLIYPPDEARKWYPGETYPPESALMVGTKGAILIPNGGAPQLYPLDKFKGTAQPKLETRNHYHHYLDAILGSAVNESFFEQTGPMTEAILLGTVAIRTPDEVLYWDPKKLAITNNPVAHGLLKRNYRKGWEVADF